MLRIVIRNIYATVAALVGILLLCVAALDWDTYTEFLILLTWK